MEERRERIDAKCPLYACRVCRTKTGWPHQCWCVLTDVVSPVCPDCQYWSAKKNDCAHPRRRRKAGTPSGGPAERNEGGDAP